MKTQILAISVLSALFATTIAFADMSGTTDQNMNGSTSQTGTGDTGMTNPNPADTSNPNAVMASPQAPATGTDASGQPQGAAVQNNGRVDSTTTPPGAPSSANPAPGNGM